MALKFVCFVSSVREGRNADRMILLLKSYFKEILTPQGHTLEIVDPRDYDLPLVKKPFHFHRDPAEAPEILHKLNKIILDADAYLILTTEYNRTIPPALLNLMDHIPTSSYELKASGIIAYAMGPAGGAFAVSALRQFLSEMGCLPVKHFITVGAVHQAVKEDGTTENPHIASSFKKLFGEVEWWARAAKAQRDSAGKPNQK